MNILILSVGTRNKIVQYFKKELSKEDLVIATDASDLAPALYEADRQYIVPKITAPGYIDEILSICKKEKVQGVLSLIDPELSLIAKNAHKFLEIGVMPIISDENLVELSFDKFEFSNFVEELGFNAVKSYIDVEKFKIDLEANKINFPVFVKPILGSASININKVENMEQLNDLLNRYDDLLIQELMDEGEYGVDVYADLYTGKVTRLFIKEKLLMRAGETDKSVSKHIDKLQQQIIEFVEKAGYKGVIDVDVFVKNGEFFISEVNPRFGGGYPHAYELGVNIPKQIINNLNKINNESNFEYPSNVYMMKYNEIKTITTG